MHRWAAVIVLLGTLDACSGEVSPPAPAEPTSDSGGDDDGAAGGDPGGLPDAGPSDGGAADGGPPAPGPDAGPEAPVPRPAPPAALQHWITGNADDARANTAGPGVILMGGGTDVRDAFEWQRDRLGGGDVVVLRTSGSDGYNEWLFDSIGGIDSVETVLVDTRALADDAYVGWVVDHAEAIFLAGGDQATYVETWQGTRIQRALRSAWSRGVTVGGTSAGCAVLGRFAFSAERGSISSVTALADPFDRAVTLRRDFTGAPPLARVITDTHFAERDRMGRLVAFLARLVADGWDTEPLGLGVDPATAVVIDELGDAEVLGSGAAYLLAPKRPPETATPGTPLTWSQLPFYELRSGDRFSLPSGAPRTAPRTLSVDDGALRPDDPY